jgi:IS1 family transposase
MGTDSQDNATASGTHVSRPTPATRAIIRGGDMSPCLLKKRGSVLICLFGAVLCLCVGAAVGTWKALPRSGLGDLVVNARPCLAETGFDDRLAGQRVLQPSAFYEGLKGIAEPRDVDFIEGVPVFDKPLYAKALLTASPSSIFLYQKGVGDRSKEARCISPRVDGSWSIIGRFGRVREGLGKGENQIHSLGVDGYFGSNFRQPSKGGRWRLPTVGKLYLNWEQPIVALSSRGHYLIKLWLRDSGNHPRAFGSDDVIGLFQSGFSGSLCSDNAPASDKHAPSSYASEQNGECIGYPIRNVAFRIALNRDVCGGEFADSYGAFFVFCCFAIGIILELFAAAILFNKRDSWFGWSIAIVSGLFWIVAAVTPVIGRLPWDWGRSYDCKQNSDDNQPQHDAKIVYQKPLTLANLWFTVIDRGLVMANVLNTDKQIAVIAALAEGSSIRSIERMTGVHRDTIMRLGVKVGQGCTALMDDKMRDLPCNRLEMDEIWGFIGKKDRHVREGDDPQFGNVWTFCAIDADTKLVPAFRVGQRDTATANAFVRDVASRMANRVQISTDGLGAYVDAIETAFGDDADYGQVIKTYGVETSIQPQRRYSQPEITAIEKKAISGRPNFDLISTSYIERLNGTTRLHMKRLARLTHAFSKKRVNFEAAVGLHFAYYNFVKRHSTIRCTPAMAAGVVPSFWSVGDLVEAAA